MVSEAECTGLQRVWGRLGRAELKRGWSARLQRLAMGGFDGVPEDWSSSQRALLVALASEIPFIDLCTAWTDLADCATAVSILAFRGLVEPAADGGEPVLTRRGFILADRLQDEAVFDQVPA